ALVVVLQTVSANTGSMLTPVGNPQNLFLYNNMGVPLAAFVRVLLPYTVLCGVLLAAALLLVPKTPLAAFAPSPARSPSAGWKKILYAVLFGCCLLAVAGGIPKGSLALGVLIAVLVCDRATLLRTDLFLLATFVAFFIFSGNLAAVPAVTAFLQSSVRGHELGAGVAVSQVISNVPATLLLYPFVQDVRALLVGVNIGGLGTLVASLASLISFSLYVKSGRGGGAYLALFTVVNAVGLLTLLAFSAILSLWFPA
ncbi:MAG: citrate transporter, partial [Treponemataceae bacterium]|nr:citrate transporter [Treponemataceae bacterium]